MLRRWFATYLVAAVALSLAVTACGGSSPQPQSTLTPFLNAWSRGNWTGMRRLVADPPADFVSANRKAFAALGVTHARFTVSRIVQPGNGDRVVAHVTAHYTLPHVGAFEPKTTVTLVKRQKRWRVAWSMTCSKRCFLKRGP